jgi:hypothetical protein
MCKYVIAAVIAILLLIGVSPAFASVPNSFKPDKAADVQIVKKVTFKGSMSRGGKTAPTAATGILGDPLAKKAEKYAIVIGIKDYPGTSADLQYTVADADLMSQVLTNTYGFPARNVTELTDSEATYTAIQNAVSNLQATAREGDEVVFYFSGHGAKGKADDGDNNNMDQAIVVQENGQFAFIWDGDLVQWFSGFRTNLIIFIFDSCLSGGMSVLKTSGRVVCMASTINSMSLEGAIWGGGHGQFTYYFAEEGMEYSLADRYDSIPRVPDVTVEEAFDYANANCKSQTPTVADGFTNDLLP